MNNTDLFDEVAINFPPTWPIDPKLEWVLIHDGKQIKTNNINLLLEQFINTTEGIVVVHSEPGIAKKVKIQNVIEAISKHMLNEVIQIANLELNSFITILKTGVAAGCKY